MLLFLKIITYAVAFCYFLNTLLSYYKVETDILSHIGSVSLLLLVYLYLSSFSFKFCTYHRIPLHYILVNNVITMLDYYIGISIDDLQLLMLNLIMFGVFMFLLIYFRLKCRH